MSTPLAQRLYLRIWLAVVGAIVLLTLIFGWIWRAEAERERAQRPGREIILRNAQGEVLGQAQARGNRVPGQGWEFEVPLRNGQTVFVQLPRPGNRPPPTPAPSWWQPPYSFLALLVLVASAVALGADEHCVLPEHEIAPVAPDGGADPVGQRLLGRRQHSPQAIRELVFGHFVHDRRTERHRRAGRGHGAPGHQQSGLPAWVRPRPGV